MTDPKPIGELLKDRKLPEKSSEVVVENNRPDTDEKAEQQRYILDAMPPRYRDLLPDFEMLEKVKKGGVILTGGVGTGKTRKMLETVAAYLIESMNPMFGASPVSEKQIRRIFRSVPDVLREIKEEFDDPGSPRIVQNLIDAKILFLDDLGAEKASDWVKEQLYIVLNDRYNWCKPVMFTSNLQISEIAEHYGDRFTSRLIEMTEQIKLTGKDWRAK